MKSSPLTLFVLCGLLSAGACHLRTEESTDNPADRTTDKHPGMCAKQPMTDDGIVRLSLIEVYPEHLDAYLKYAAEVGEISLRTEPGVLTM